MTAQYAEDSLRYSTATHTVLFVTRDGAAGKWTRWRKAKQAAAERQQAAVVEAHQSASSRHNKRKETHGTQEEERTA